MTRLESTRSRAGTKGAQGAKARKVPAQDAGATQPADLDLPRFLRPGLPKYVGLRDAMVHAITTGKWPPGARLPNENTLAGSLPLSLGTIQRALRMLVDDGVIVRRPGAGTFVARASDGAMHAPLHCRFVEEGGGYLPVYPRILARYEAEAGAWTAVVGQGAMCIERSLRIGDEFTVFSRFYFDPTRLPALATLGATELAAANFKDVILRASGLTIGRILQYLAASRLPANIAQAMGCRAGAACMKLDIEAYGGREVPLYYQTLWIPRTSRRLELAGDGRDVPSLVSLGGG